MTNKELIRSVFVDLANGNGAPFVDAMADDFRWTIAGSTPWSGTYEGKESVRRDLLAPLFAQFATRYRNTAQRLIAEGDYVVVQCRGEVLTDAGRAYNNDYCWVIRFADGKMRELTEYLDTELVSAALTAPAGRATPAPPR